MKIHLLKNLLYFLAICSTLSVNAQQDPIFSQYLANPLAYNPAYAGTYDMVNTTAVSRLQSLGSSGSAITNGIAVHSSFPSTDVMGLGVYVVNQKYSIVKSTDITLAYSYKIKINDYTRLSFGLQSTVMNRGFNYEGLTYTADQLNSSDPMYTQNKLGFTKLNFGGGLYLINQEKFFASLSVPKIVANKFAPGRNGISAENFKPTIYLSGGVILGGKGNLPVRPSFLIRTTKGLPAAVDLSTSVLLSKIIWAGVSLRNFKTMAILAQVDISEHLRIGYSSDFPFTTSEGKSFNTHEFSVNLNFAAFKKQTVIPRFF